MSDTNRQILAYNDEPSQDCPAFCFYEKTDDTSGAVFLTVINEPLQLDEWEFGKGATIRLSRKMFNVLVTIGERLRKDFWEEA